MKLQYLRNPPGVADVKEDGALTVEAELDDDGNVVVNVARRNQFARDEKLQLVLTEAEWDTLKTDVDAAFA